MDLAVFKKNAKLIAQLFFLFFFALSVYADEKEAKPNNMAVTLQSGGMVAFMAGGSFGGGARFEYAFLPTVSIIVPIEYRVIAIGAFAENRKFEAVTGGLGARFYFSQLFWHQRMLSGFFAEAHIAGGFAKENPGDKFGIAQPFNNGATLAISGALGYSHAFDIGLILGLSVNMSVRGYKSPIEQTSMVANTLPELLAHIGWSF